MTPLEQALAEYLTIRRSLGYKLKRTEQLLRQCVTYLDHCGEPRLRVWTMLRWATLSDGEQSGRAAYRLGIVRRFASHLRDRSHT